MKQPDIQTARSGTSARRRRHERRDFLKRSTAAFALAGLGAVRATPSLAQDYPTQPIRLIVPFPAGGAADVVARITAKHLSDQLGQQIFIDNRGGAGGTIGTDAAARSTPDGYTLVMHTISSAVLNKFLYTRVKLDVADEVRADFPGRHRCPALGHQCQAACAEFARTHRAAEGQSGQVSLWIDRALARIMHLSGELFSFMAETEVVHVPYRGEGAGDGGPYRGPHSI